MMREGESKKKNGPGVLPPAFFVYNHTEASPKVVLVLPTPAKRDVLLLPTYDRVRLELDLRGLRRARKGGSDGRRGRLERMRGVRDGVHGGRVRCRPALLHLLHL